MRLGSASSSNLIRNLGESSTRVSKAYERLSSGMRINRASDDAAGLAIADSLRSDARIYGQAIRNANDGISLSNVALGAFTEMTGILQRQAELAEQAANGTYGEKQRAALDLEAKKLSEEFNRIVQTTEFNGINLFDVNTGDIVLSVGVNSTDTRTISEIFLGGTAQSSTWDSTYTSMTNYATTGRAAFIAPADFNGDGYTDVATGNSTNSIVTIYFNQGNGQLSAGTTYSTAGVTPIGISAGDMNGDGRVDLITKNQGGNTSVLLNNGAGFTKSDYGSGLGSYGNSDLGDLDGDGDLDYVSQGSANAFGIFLNNGQGQMTTFTTINVGYSAGLAIGDMNSDGLADILATNDAGNSRIYRNTGAGSWTLDSTLIGFGGNDAQIGDINGDGKNDILSSGWATGALNYALGNGDGTFGATVSLSIGTQTNGFQLVDLNGDRAQDAVLSGYGNGQPIILMNDGQGNFSNQGDGLQSGLGSGWGAAAADLNGDGVPDLITGDYNNGVGVALAGNNSQYLPVFDLRTQGSARSAITGIKNRMDKLSQATGDIGAVQSRLAVVISTLGVRKDTMLEAEGRIRDADIAKEAAELTARQIQQQLATQLLKTSGQQNSQMILALLSF